MKKIKKIIPILCGLLIFASAIIPNVGLAFADEKQNYFKKIESDAGEWAWKGFMAVENDKASRLWEHGTFSAGASGEVRFKGTTVEIFGFKGSIGGEISVEIDGEEKENVSLVAGSDQHQTLIASYSDLSADWHTLKVTSLSEGKWHAIDYVRVDIEKEAYLQNYNLALIGDIICSVSVDSLIGGGNRDMNVIRNEKLYPVGTAGAGPAQYDSYTGGGRGYFYMGYSFKEMITFDKLIFQEGDTWHDGGWFSDGDIKVQVRTAMGWKDVELVAPIGYPMSDLRADFGQSCEIYIFDFKPIAGNAIRLFGMTGGTSNFVSISQIEVYANDDAKTLAEYSYLDPTVFEYVEKQPDDSSIVDSGSDSNGSSSEKNEEGKTGCASTLFGIESIALSFVVLAGVVLNKKRKN